MWVAGRQGSGYEKMLLATAPVPVGWDLYLLRYPPGSYIDPHRDPVTGRHYRVNFELKRPQGGGEFLCESDAVLFRWWRLVLFRPDIGTHSVSEVQGNQTRYVLSCGWVLR